MSDAGPYFLDENQPILPGVDDDRVIFSEEERKGIYTAERLKEYDEDKFNLVVRLLADPGISYRRITRGTGCHHDTLKAVERNHPKLIEAAKERLKLELGNVASKSVDLIKENLDTVPIKTTTDLQKVMIVGAVAIEKHELLSGNATSRVARQEERLEDLEQHFNNLPPADAVEAEYTEITGFDGADADTKEDRPPDPPH